MKSLLLICLFLLMGGGITAQVDLFFPYNPKNADLAAAERKVIPAKARYFRLTNASALRKALQKAPEQDIGGGKELLLTLPRPDGEKATFRVVRYRMITEKLQARLPALVTAEGWDVDSPQRRVSMSWTSHGFNASVVGGSEGRWYIAPLYHGQKEPYQSYFTRDYPVPTNQKVCEFVPDEKILADLESFGASKRLGDCQLREYDLALACTGEYFQRISGFVQGMGATPTTAQEDAVVAEMINAINRVNQVFKADLAIQLKIINLPDDAGNIQLVYSDTITDGYTNYDGNAMLDENQDKIDAVIGPANYDIGHVFSTGGGGIASLNSPCSLDRKAKGVTGLPNPLGDPFYIDFVAHEIGHQFGGTHTFNSTEKNCAARNAPTAYEPGSGTTIQAYAGICGATANIQLNSDPYYHAISLQQIQTFVEMGGGASCDTQLSTANTAPSLSGAGGPYTIPVNTPFVLDVNGSDTDGDNLSYCWEQFDRGNVVAGIPTGFEPNAPLFRSFPPTSESARYFPRLSKVMTGSGSDWEVLPRIERSMNFIVTIRDNAAGSYGCPVQEQVTVSTVNTGSTYAVTAPNGGENWPANSTQTVTWDVGGTDGNGIDCATVEILLSTDSGQSFPTSLGTFANDGAAEVIMPPLIEQDARILIRCVGNIFFDVSDADFSIVDVAFNLSGITTSAANCLEADEVTGYQVEVNALQGYVGTVNLTATNLPGSTTAVVSPSSVTFTNGGPTSQVVEVAVSGVSSLASGNYIFNLSAEDGGTPKTIDLELTKAADFGLNAPIDGLLITANPDGKYSFTVNHDAQAGATGYQLFIAGFTNPIDLGNQPNQDINYTLTISPAGSTREVYVKALPDGQTTCTVDVIFGVAGPAPSLTALTSELEICETRTTTETYRIVFSDGSLTGPATLSTQDAPVGLTLQYSATQLTDGTFSDISLDGEENLAPGNYNITVRADDGSATEDIILNLIVLEDVVAVTQPAQVDSEVQIQSVFGDNCPGGNGILNTFTFGPYTGPGTPVGYRLIVSKNGTLFDTPVIPSLDDPLDRNYCAADGDVFTYYVLAELPMDQFVQSCERTLTAVVALPVEWLSFGVTPTEKSVLLAWSVEQDPFHAGFTVEHRTEGQQEWQDIATVPRRGGNGTMHYHHYDQAIISGRTHFYRLRQEDYDGSFDYSPIRSIAIPYFGASIRVFPNPTSDDIMLTVGTATPSDLHYEIFTSLGRRITTAPVQGNHTDIDLSQQPPGVYLLTVTNGKQFREVRRIIKR